MKLYLRFGEIPIDEQSTIWYHQYTAIGKEPGVSCYDCVKDDANKYRILVPLKPKEGFYGTLREILENFSIENTKTNCYLITGDIVGIGMDGEPLLKNIMISLFFVYYSIYTFI